MPKPREDRRFDQTYLSANSHGVGIHRDYAAHFFRWGFAQRFLTEGTRVIDVGCGPEIPLYKAAAVGNQQRPKMITCVDISKLRMGPSKHREVLSEFDFVNRWPELASEIAKGEREPYDIACNFEVIEHMEPKDGLELLRGLCAVLRPGGTLLLSTPIIAGSGRQARNHIHEYEIEELRALVEQAGFTVAKRYGTFASLPTIRKELKRRAKLVGDENTNIDDAAVAEAGLELLDQLGEYYSNAVLSCFLAPLYPDHSRNNLWVLTKGAE